MCIIYSFSVENADPYIWFSKRMQAASILVLCIFLHGYNLHVSF